MPFGPAASKGIKPDTGEQPDDDLREIVSRKINRAPRKIDFNTNRRSR
jgi:hypothetical protein